MKTRHPMHLGHPVASGYLDHDTCRRKARNCCNRRRGERSAGARRQIDSDRVHTTSSSREDLDRETDRETER